MQFIIQSLNTPHMTQLCLTTYHFQSIINSHRRETDTTLHATKSRQCEPTFTLFSCLSKCSEPNFFSSAQNFSIWVDEMNSIQNVMYLQTFELLRYIKACAITLLRVSYPFNCLFVSSVQSFSLSIHSHSLTPPPHPNPPDLCHKLTIFQPLSTILFYLHKEKNIVNASVLLKRHHNRN